MNEAERKFRISVVKLTEQRSLSSHTCCIQYFRIKSFVQGVHFDIDDVWFYFVSLATISAKVG